MYICTSNNSKQKIITYSDFHFKIYTICFEIDTLHNCLTFKIITMKRNKFGIPLLSFILLFFIYQLLICGCTPEQSINLTAEEKKWLAENDGKIIIAPDPFFPPMEFFDENQQYSGISADLVKLISQKLNIRFKIKKMESWAEIEKQGENKQIDISTCIQSIERRRNFWLFTEPYLKVETVVLVNKNNTQIKTFDDFKNQENCRYPKLCCLRLRNSKISRLANCVC